MKVIFEILVFRITPTFLRNERFLAWFRALMAPLQTLNDDFLIFAQSRRIDVVLNGQTIVLEWTLNRLFDPNFNDNWPNSKQIKIKNITFLQEPTFLFNESELQDPVFFFNEAENLQSYSEKRYLFNQLEVINGYDFIVEVNSALTLTAQQLQQLEAVVNKFKIAGKIYVVNII